ncbi:hypothetical protein Tco_1260665, partial [Tanacetum coccineum]
RNKPELDTMSFDDLYNNFKIAEQKVKGTASSITTASTQVSTANLSDDTVYAFLASQPNRSHLVHKNLEQIHEDDLEEMDMKWQLALLSMRTRKFFQKTGRKITINRSDIAGYYKSNSFMADEEVPTDMALMSFSDSENEVLFCEQLAVLKRDISYKDSEISVLKSELEKLKQEKESNQLKIENFDNASKSLDKLIGSQILDKSRKGLGFVSYNVVLPPPTGLFSPPTIDLSNSGLEEFQQPEFEGYRPMISKNISEDISNEVMKSSSPLVNELVSNDKLEKKIVFPIVAKINFVKPQQQEKPVKYVEMYKSQTPKGNQRN